MELEEYRQKRAFERTPEPTPVAKTGEGPLRFVVQKHRARQLHYDFRLELDGVLKSWSVPKGPSLDPDAKHLAVMVEDHPLDYASFEGVIPKGEYGAGEVIVWDAGTYSPDEGGRLLFHDRAAAEMVMRQGLANGKLSFTLRGSKLRGSFTLVKMKNRESDWLIMKHRDEYASPGGDILENARSVISERTIEDVRAGRQPDAPALAATDPSVIPGSRGAPFPTAISPMLASLAPGPFSNPAWMFEPKLDGYRIIAFVQNGQVTLRSRRGNDVTAQYSVLVPDLARQAASEVILDGEIIALDEKGRQCFQCLQQYLESLGRGTGKKEGGFPLVYYVFDILYLDGYDLTQVDLRHRKSLLLNFLKPMVQVRLIDYFEGEGDVVYRAAIDSGLEGVMAKEIESTYEQGRRSRHWLKVKAMQSDEFVIGGFSVSEKGRAETFSSLLLGYFDEAGRMMFAGHVGTGFDERSLNNLRRRLDVLKTERCPFSEMPPLNAPTTWVRPELVAEVKFAEWTQDGRLRIPVFIRLREDKSPAEVRRAQAVVAPESHADLPGSRTLAGVLEQLQNPKESFTLQADSIGIKLNNLGKAMWPATGAHRALTKRDLLTYLAQVASYILPHLKDRPLSLSRYPDGIYGEHFFQKHWGHPLPAFVQTVNIREDKGSEREYILCNNLPTLLWLGQVADIEFHTWFSRATPGRDAPPGARDTDSLLNFPDFIIFDIDPYIYSGQEPLGAEPELSREGFKRAGEVAQWLKEVLDELGLNAFVKTSGKTGLHIYVPIVRRLDYKAVRSAAETIGGFLVARHPKEITMDWAVEKRRGKVFLDYGQNARGKTLASVYSPRPTPEASVSTPLRWGELGNVYPTDFSILTLPERLRQMGDLWAGILEAKRDLSELLMGRV